MHYPKSLISCLVVLGFSNVAVADEKVNFEDHVKPIFRAKCASCHNTNKKTADLDLSNYTALMQGGGSGPSIEPGDPESSYLFLLINHDSEPYMPPNSDRIPDAMINTVKSWIEQGAPETSSSKVMIPKKATVNLSVDVSGDRPTGAPPMPDVLGLEPIVRTSSATAVSAIATSPWAKLTAVAGQKQVILYHSETLEPLGVLPFPEGQARVLKFSRSGALLLAGGGHGASKGLAVVWNVRNGERVMQVGDELDEVLAADISADQSLIALGGPGKIVRVYSTDTGELAYEITKHTDWIYSLEFSPDSVLLATSDRAGGLHVWEAFTGRQYLTLNGHKGAVNSVSWRLDSNVLASASEDASVKLWEMENGRNIKSWNAHGGGTLAMEFCRDGRIATCGRDKTTKLWDQNGKQIRAFEAFGDLALQVSFCDETNRMIAGDWMGEIRVWKAEDGKRIGTITTNPPTLESRLQSANDSIPTLTKQLTADAASLQTASAAFDVHKGRIKEATAKLAAAKKSLADHETEIKALEKSVAEDIAQQAANKVQVDSLAKAVPELESAAKKAAEALKLMSGDPELNMAVEKLNLQVAQRKANLATVQKLAVTINTRIGKTNSQITEAKKLIPADHKLITEVTASLKKLTEGVKAFQEKVAKAEGVRNAAQARLDAATTSVAKWQQYVALKKELDLLKETKKVQEAALLASLEADAEVTQMREAIDASAAVVQARVQEMVTTEANIAALRKAAQEATVRKASIATAVNSHEKAIPVLQAAVQQAKAAAGMLPADTELNGAVTSLEKTAGDKAKKLSQLKGEVQQLDKKIAESGTGMVTAKAAMDAAVAAKAQAEKQVAVLTTGITARQQVADQAKARLTAAESELSRVQAVVEARREKIRPGIQVSQVSPR